MRAFLDTHRLLLIPSSPGLDPGRIEGRVAGAGAVPYLASDGTLTASIGSESMPDTAAIDSVTAGLNYVVDTGVKPVNRTMEAGNMARIRTGTYETRETAIRNGRPLREAFSLDKTGFVFVDHPTETADFFDPEDLASTYYPEVEALVERQTGARRVLVFDHTLRSGSESTREERKVREPVTQVHNDYTEWSGPQRVRDLLPDEADALLGRRFAIVQVWRAIARPIESHPLAIADASSLAAENLVAAERRYPDRVGETYQISYAPGHRWYYFPRMTRDEALVFKVYDSATDGRARFTAHTAFDDPTTPPGAPERESIEMRTIAFF